MRDRDPHTSLKSQKIATVGRNNLECVVARLQWGKDDVAYSLHVYPSSYTTSGIQTTDFLSYLEFNRSDQCPFTSGRQCFVKWVPEIFDPDAFLTAFTEGFSHLDQADRGLQACGYRLPQPEGWGFFYGRGGRAQGRPLKLVGDGHTAQSINVMKQTEDD